MKHFLICGGDLRQVHLANSLAHSGYKVTATGFSKTEDFSKDVLVKEFSRQLAEKSDVIVFPLPMSTDDKTISTPMQDEKIYLEDLFSYIDTTKIAVGGKVSEKVKAFAKEKNITIYDYLEREELAVLNAVPTVEGAIQIAMENLPVTIHGLKVLVLGFGRIGKLLCEKFSALGAFVTCEARKPSDLAWIKAYGYESLSLDKLPLEIGKYDLIINTVPKMIVNRELIEKIKDDALIIDLASKPGGVDMEAASKSGKKVIWALSLPGSVAPISAAIIIKDTILNILSEPGVWKNGTD